MSKEISVMTLFCMFSTCVFILTKSVFLAVGAVIFIPFLFKLKGHALLLFVAFSYFRFQEAIPFLLPFKIPKLLALCTIALLLIDVFLKETKSLKITKENKIVILLLCYMPLNIVFSTIPSETMYYFTSVYIKVLLMAYILSVSITTKEDLKNLSRMIIMGGLIIGTIAIYNKVNGIGLVEGTRVTISRDLKSILGDPNDLALIILFPLSFAISFLSIKTNLIVKIIAVISSLLMVSAILATQSRGGLLGVCIIFFLFANNKIKSKYMLFGLSIVGILLLLLFSGILDRSVLNEADAGAVDASAQSRLDSWITAIYMFFDNPMFGIGMNTFINNYYFYTEAWDGKFHETHSTWLKALSEGGFIYFSLFMTMIYQTGKRIWDLKKNILFLNNDILKQAYYSLFYAFFGFVVSSTFLTQTYTWPIYIIWAMSIGLLTVTKKELE